MNAQEFQQIQRAVSLAVDRVVERGADDVFRPPVFSHSIEIEIIKRNPDEFRKFAVRSCIDFLKKADLQKHQIGMARRSFVCKDANTFRQVAWLDPFDAAKYLAVAIILFEKIEGNRLPKADGVVHSHRSSDDPLRLFDDAFGYDSFRSKSSELSRENIGKWKVVTDVANFFDRVGNHSLENHLLNIGCEKRYVDLAREILLFWSGDRRSFGVPVGSDASRILSEAVLIDVDKKLKASGINFVRYVDDYRIFCDCRASSLHAIQFLTTLLSEEGLALNSKKTLIFRIADDEEAANLANQFAPGEHEGINLDEKIEIRKLEHLSGRSSISKYYREPGKDAVKKLSMLSKSDLLKNIEDANDSNFEQLCKMAVKYFIYVDQDVAILISLIRKRITAVFYISDALCKESEKLTAA